MQDFWHCLIRFLSFQLSLCVGFFFRVLTVVADYVLWSISETIKWWEEVRSIFEPDPDSCPPRQQIERKPKLTTTLRLIHSDQHGELFEEEGGVFGSQPLMLLRVRNSTPEPDGSFRSYLLRVPPTCRTAREAAAWTFGFEDSRDYRPEIET